MLFCYFCNIIALTKVAKNDFLYRFIITLFFKVLFLCTLNINYAQCDFSLKGSVTDSKTNIPFAYATVKLNEIIEVATADSNGTFEFTNLCKGTYSVEIQSIFNETFNYTIELKTDTLIHFKSDAAVKQLVTINIIQDNSILDKSPLTTQLNSQQIEQNHGQSIAEMLGSSTESSVLKTGSNIAKPVVNGMHGYRLLVYNNDIRLEGQQWGQEHAPEIDTYLAHSVTLMKGAATLQYGHDAMAGVIVLQSKPLQKIESGLNGQLNTSFFSNGRGGSTALILEGKSKNVEGLYWRTQGSLKRMGDLHSPTYSIQNTGIKEYNFSLTSGYFRSKWGIELFYSQFNSEIGIFKGSHIGNLSDLEDVLLNDRNDVNTPFSYYIDRPKQYIEHELFKVKSTYYTNSNQTITLLLGRQYNLRSEYDLHIPRIDSMAALNKPQLQYELVTYSGDLSYKVKHKKGRGNHLLGTQVNTMTNVYDGRYFIPNYIQNTLGMYLSEQLTLKKWNVAASVRYDYKNLTSYFWQNNEIVSPNRLFQNTAYSCELGYQPNQKNTLYLNLSKTWRAPSVNELYSSGLHHGTASFEKGNDQLTLEQQYQIAFGYTYTNKNTLFAVAPFASIIQDYIYITPTLIPILTIQGAFPAFEYQQKDVVYSGMTAQINQSLFNNRLQLNIRGSVLRVFEKQTKEYIFGIPADNLTSKITYNFSNNKNEASKKFKNNRLSGQWLYAAKQSRVNPNYDYAPPPPAYSIFSIQYSTEFHLKNQTLTCYLGVDNIFNTLYKDYMNRLRYFSNEMGRNLSIRLAYKF